MDKELQQQPLDDMATSKFDRAFKENEIEHYIELGLGRGVDITNPDLWKSKSSLLVRKPCKKNIIGTQECGLLEGYKKVVSTFEMQQNNLSFSFGMVGASPVKIGMDEQFSRRFSSTKQIEGQRIETRTISFRSHFYDASHDENEDILEAPENFLHESNFEEDIAKWLIKCMNASDDKIEEQFIAKLVPLIKADNQKAAVECSKFVKQLGITHYISAIKLGACEYYFSISNSEQTSLAVGISEEASSQATARLSTLFEKFFFFKGEEKRKIGRINKKKEKVTQEAVIGFEIQPLYKLVRIPRIQSHLKKAIKEYIQSKQSG